MEQAAASFAESIGHLGEGYLFTIGIIVILAFVAVKAMPMIADGQAKRIEIEAKREERKAEEVKTRAQRDRERSEMEGRWLTQYEHATRVQEQTNMVIEGVREQMMMLNQALDDSKSRSHEMAEQVQEIHQEVVMTN
jgi:membrane-associated HD superfamily phosphohydrolase